MNLGKWKYASVKKIVFRGLCFLIYYIYVRDTTHIPLMVGPPLANNAIVKT